MKPQVNDQNSGLKENEIKVITNVFENFPEIDEVILYGSRAKGNYRTGSDIDFTLKGDKLTHKLLNKISLKLDDLLLPFIFELSLYDQIENNDLIDHIDRVGKTFYKNNNRYPT